MTTITLEGGITFFGIIITPYVNTAAWFGGANLSTVDRITYATDTATASVRGPLSGARNYLAAASGVQ